MLESREHLKGESPHGNVRRVVTARKDVASRKMPTVSRKRHILKEGVK
jgi:hypothetical protein